MMTVRPNQRAQQRHKNPNTKDYTMMMNTTLEQLRDC